MTLEDVLRVIVREEIRAALDDRLPKAEAPEVLFEPVPAFAKRVAISERAAWSLAAKGMPTIGAGRGRRVDVARALAWMRAQSSRVDSAIEVQARRSASRAARAASR